MSLEPWNQSLGPEKESQTPSAREGCLRRQLESNFISSESQKVGIFSRQRSSNQRDLLALLGLEPAGNIQRAHKNPAIPEYEWEAGLCKCQTLSSITPTTTPQTSQPGHLPDLTDCYKHHTSAGCVPLEHKLWGAGTQILSPLLEGEMCMSIPPRAHSAPLGPVEPKP